MKYYNKIKNKGFTLLEALVATSILMVAVAAPITIAQKGLSSAVYSKNQMIASYLAQDAIEYVKNIRDQASVNSNYADSKNFIWDAALVDSDSSLKDCLTPAGVGSGCKIDTNALNGVGMVQLYADSDSDFLYKDTNGFYGFNGTDKTNFKRQIKITMDPYGSNSANPYEAKVNVIVTWEGDANNRVDVSTLIYNI